MIEDRQADERLPGETELQWIRRLRHSGREEQALAASREYLREHPDDIWAVRSYGWSLYAAFKAALAAGDSPRAEDLMREFDLLAIPESEEMLRKVRESGRWRLSPASATVERIREMFREKEFDQAYRLCREAMAREASPRLSTAFGWILQGLISREAHREAPNGRVLDKLAEEYLALPYLERPSVLHSAVLTAACAGAAVMGDFPAFFLRWGPEYLREEDFRPREKHPPLVAKLLSALYRSLKEQPRLRGNARIGEFLEGQVVGRINGEWVLYHCGRLLLWCGRREPARKLLVAFVMHHARDFWAWQALAETYAEDNNELWVGCLCQAMLCLGQGDEQYSLSVRRELMRALSRCGMTREACIEWHEIERIRKALGYGLPVEMELVRQSLGCEEENGGDNSKLYSEMGTRAAQEIFRDLPKVRMVLQGVILSKKGKRVSSFAWWEDGRLRESRIPVGRFPGIAECEAGRIFNAVVAEGIPVMLFAADGEAGDLVREFSGVVRRAGGRKFSFCGDVFIPESLTGECSLADGDRVRGLAVRAVDRKKEQAGWRAVKAEREPAGR